MQPELLEHAIRILQHAPGHSMSAALLHERACRETGIDAPRSRFLDALRRRTGEVTVLEALLGDAEQACWSERERAAYAGALGEAGCAGGPVLMLAAGAGPAEADDLLTDVHGALAELLRSPDAALRQVIGAAAAELHAMRRRLAPPAS